MDTTNGVIWKDGGPTIEFEIGFYGGRRAKEYPQTDKGISRTTLTLKGMSFDFVIDADQETLVATVGNYANFTATRLKSRRDFTEVMLMILTYDIARGR
jgi:hypothetical protein